MISGTDYGEKAFKNCNSWVISSLVSHFLSTKQNRLATLYHCNLAPKDVIHLNKQSSKEKLYKKVLDQSFVHSYKAVAAGPSIPIILSDILKLILCHTLLASFSTQYF